MTERQASPSTCKYCGQAVLWATTERGSKVLLNERPRTDGDWYFDGDGRAQYASPEAIAEGLDRFKCHWEPGECPAGKR